MAEGWWGVKIRRKTWYWGKFIEAPMLPNGKDADDWEPYEEEQHGWHHSEEAKEQNKP